MGTNREKYLELWIIFEKELEKQGSSLRKFANEYALAENEDVDKLYNKLKKMRQRKESIEPQNNSLMALEEYIEFLNQGYATIKLFKDEVYPY